MYYCILCEEIHTLKYSECETVFFHLDSITIILPFTMQACASVSTAIWKRSIRLQPKAG